ncbi:hypothetical protein NA56DRAFT_703201 [Hyaloscypha hepaticicola]|uniref:Uncharacterized protein n=1 Tax=Hyaloscypha hepaticicola TaxID=2082293 RepID=A0A2J6Q5J2_9HELO|nr:hypothetical protein NA56DRAFT_703201 [Hyaloscypha hepaticicola]
MIDSCKHHAHCVRLPIPRHRQTTLAIIDGFLSLSLDSHPPSRRSRRTPAGKAVRNIANTSTFSTTDSSLTSFLRFPAEYGICPIKLRLVARKQSWQPWIRHGIFPSILECCRRINAEGSAVIYGKNTFEIEQLSLKNVPCCNCSQERRSMEIIDLFPALKEVKTCLLDPTAKEWIRFLRVASGRLQRIKKFMLEIYVGSHGPQMLCRKWSVSLTTEDICLRAYQGPFLKQQDLWHNRRVGWEVEPEMDDFARSMGKLNIVPAGLLQCILPIGGASHDIKWLPLLNVVDVPHRKEPEGSKDAATVQFYKGQNFLDIRRRKLARFAAIRPRDNPFIKQTDRDGLLVKRPPASDLDRKEPGEMRTDVLFVFLLLSSPWLTVTNEPQTGEYMAVSSIRNIVAQI